MIASYIIAVAGISLDRIFFIGNSVSHRNLRKPIVYRSKYYRNRLVEIYS